SSPTPSESETTEPPDRPTPTDTTTDPTKAPSTEPSEDAGEDPGATPSGPPTTEGPRNTGGPNQPGANSDRKVDDTPDSPDSASGSLHASGAHESAATGLGAGTGNADLGAASIGETAPQATSPRLARFGTRFKTVVVPAGSNAKLRVTTYPAAGTPAGRVRVTWRTSTPSVASPIKGARTGTTTWQAGKDATVTLRTFRAGSTRIELTSPGARGATIQVTVLPQSVAKARRLRAVDLTGSSTLSAGRSTVLRPVLTPLGAVRTAGRWRSTNPAVATVDRVGRVTGHTKGRTVIVLTVGGKTTHKTITIT
ncbi:MAG: Ig-like domain-containing protein, partial [Bifidobacteriaceae bacterium]|nr:Ig-like domain-containing protein [Bifidobacteriaceae bacterium]